MLKILELRNSRAQIRTMHRCKDDDGAGRMRHCNRPVMQKEPKSLSACLQIPKLTQSRLPSEKPLLVEERIRFSLPPGFAFVTVRRLKFSFRKGSCSAATLSTHSWPEKKALLFQKKAKKEEPKKGRQEERERVRFHRHWHPSSCAQSQTHLLLLPELAVWQSTSLSSSFSCCLTCRVSFLWDFGENGFVFVDGLV